MSSLEQILNGEIDFLTNNPSNLLIVNADAIVNWLLLIFLLQCVHPLRLMCFNREKDGVSQ